MFQQLVSHNSDLNRLVERGYALAFDTNHLVIRDIPYLNEHGDLQIGAIVAKLVYTDNDHVKQDDHQIYFAGSIPFNRDGTAVQNLAGGPHAIALSPDCSDVVVQRSFSNKPIPAGCYADFFEKIESYVTQISGPAMNKFDTNPYTYRVVKESNNTSVFKFHDTMTTRAEITNLSARFENDVVAVIGLGGTGSYLLDFLVKTPVRAIRAFDSDAYHVHNAFRSPGRLEEAEFCKTKAEVYQTRYENFRHGLSIVPEFIDSSSAEHLNGVTFAFVCVDQGSARSEIFKLLLAQGIPFIDVGMGLDHKNEGLKGQLRVTYFSIEDGANIRDKGYAQLQDSEDDLYQTNIQISELNALNASLAMIKFKKLRGFYSDSEPQYHSIFNLRDQSLMGNTDEN